jgi:hypothetical protein
LGSATGVGNCGTSILKFKIKSNTPPQAAWFDNFKAYIGKGIQPSEQIRIEKTNSICTPTENITTPTTFAIFPNPTNSNITLRTTNTDLVNQKIQLHDALGRLLHITTLQSTEQTIDLSEYAAGMYMLRIGTETMKVMVAK